MKKIRFCWLVGAILLACCWASAQSTETVLYSFGAYSNDGVGPSGGVQFDGLGNIYGTTVLGGGFCQESGGCGTVYELSPSDSGWSETILYSFCTTGNQFTCQDGAHPWAGLISDSLGNLYGTTFYGGEGMGTVFELSPPAPGGGTWTENVLWSFRGGKEDGAYPYAGKLNKDAGGRIYGATVGGGAHDMGTIFQLSPAPGGVYTFSILHSFSGPDGAFPDYGVALDKAGNLYGTTKNGGVKNCDGGTAGCGVVYELSQASGGWSETVLYRFGGVNASYPISPITLDQAGNLYGTFSEGGEGECFFGDCGGVFKLTLKPGGGSSTHLFFFDGQSGGGVPQGGVLVDEETGSVFGTTSDGGPGNVYMITGKTETVLYNFCSLQNCADGRAPSYGLVVGRSGRLYGAAINGGQYVSGVVYSLSQ